MLTRPARRGVTLLELIVVLAILGVILALAVPAFVVPRASSTSDLVTAMSTARRAAVLRGEPVTFAMDDGGAWRIYGDASPSAPPIATGVIATFVGRLRVRVSANGTCIPEPIDGVRLPDWNAVDCRPVPVAEAPRP